MTPLSATAVSAGIAALPEHGVFRWPVRVYWEDTDAGGVVFYANYLKFFERARTEWLRALGVQQQLLRATDGGMFVVSGSDIRYHRPARLDDQLLVTTWALETGRVCMTIRQQAHLASPAGDPVLSCDATVRIAWVDSVTFRPSRIPASILKVLP